MRSADSSQHTFVAPAVAQSQCVTIGRQRPVSFALYEQPGLDLRQAYQITTVLSDRTSWWSIFSRRLPLALHGLEVVGPARLEQLRSLMRQMGEVISEDENSFVVKGAVFGISVVPSLQTGQCDLQVYHWPFGGKNCSGRQARRLITAFRYLLPYFDSQGIN